MNVDEQILQIVNETSFDRFTAFELKKVFEEKIDEDFLEIPDLIRFVCAQMKLLTKSGVIERSRKDHIFSGIYVKTANQHIHKNTQHDASGIGLKEKYNAYKQQLLIGMGEADEYKLLCRQHPYLQEKIQPKYNKIRDANSRLLGKIRVIESLLN